MINRREFFQYSGIVGTAVLVGMAARQYAMSSSAASDTFRTFDALINHLFNDHDGYVTSQLNTIGYFKAVLADQRIPVEDREYLVNGVRWLDETSREEFAKAFTELDHKEREQLLKLVSSLRWGNRWLYRVMGYYFETVFSDPIYGGNVEGRGWKWLDYHPGFPRPNEVAI